MGGRRLYREYDKETGELIKLECCHCKEIKDVSCFSKSKHGKDGVNSCCKQCSKKINLQWRGDPKKEGCEIPKLYREYDKETGELIKRECSKCHEIKTVDCFQKDKNRKDGFRSSCKQCRNEQNRQYHKNNRKKELERKRQYRENHKEEIYEKNRQYRKYKSQQEITKIYENVTNKRYPHNGIQYGIIYGVYNTITNRWYIGQTTTSFNVRYYGDFFKYKPYELYDDNTKAHLLQDDIEKYGKEKFEIVEVLDVAFSERELDEKEAYYIDLYKSYDEGYNSNRGNIFKHGKEKRRNNNEIYK